MTVVDVLDSSAGGAFPHAGTRAAKTGNSWLTLFDSAYGKESTIQTFKGVEFDLLKNAAGSNSFTLSPNKGGIIRSTSQ
jgi:hypothetical protein